MSLPRAQTRTSPGLLLVGGGDWDEIALRWFGKRAGHGHIVVISASGGRETGDELYREIGGLASVETIEFHSRERPLIAMSSPS